MRINHLIIKNFKGFKHSEFNFHPQFNLIVGGNGTGKTSLLDALSVALGSWFLGFDGYETRHIRPHEVLLEHSEAKESTEPGQGADANWNPQYPCQIRATGEVTGRSLSWMRTLNTPDGRTTSVHARDIKNLAAETHKAVRSGGEDVLPLISYYGTGRLWNVPREHTQIKDEKKITRRKDRSRLAGYHKSTDPRLSGVDLVLWIARHSWITYQRGGHPSSLFKAVLDAIVGCVEGTNNLYFDASFGEIIVKTDELGEQPFNNLSDGQRCMMAVVGDIARRAATLNMYMGTRVLEETPGVVLIDELDLHLHPRWQRRVIKDLRRTFPKIQFFATTHSPQLIGQAMTKEIILLNEKDKQHPGQSYGMDSNWILRHIMDSKDRDSQVSDRFDVIFEAIGEGHFAEAKEGIEKLRAEIGEHPDLVEAEALISDYTRFVHDEV